MNPSDTLCQAFPENRIIEDTQNHPSVMVYLPKFLLSDVIEGASATPHPAFVVEGRVLPGIYISKFQNVVAEGCACSLPERDPATRVNFDAALEACTNKGAGWHLMTAMEWGAVALWCLKNGTLPFGNNDMGKDVREDKLTAKIAYSNEEKSICRTATGTGPTAWSHNRRRDGIYDLNGNVWEWMGGLRLVHGELQLLPDNNGASASCDQARESPDWRAVDGTTGAYLIPNGAGTTKNSIKLDYRNDAWVYVTEPIKDNDAHARFCDFADVRADSSLSPAAKDLLWALALLPPPAYNEQGVSLYANNGASERLLFRGGRWGQGLNTGVFKSCLDDPRSFSGDAVGFRAAYFDYD